MVRSQYGTSRPGKVRDKTSAVFVSTDPERDTPEVPDQWLASFDNSFVGLTGDLGQVKTAAKGLAVTVEHPEHHHEGTVTSRMSPSSSPRSP
ncbi:SCO family protein [Streptomyces sp. NPDC054833]